MVRHDVGEPGSFGDEAAALLGPALIGDSVSDDAAGPLRALIERVMLTPRDDVPGGLAAELFGDVAEILAMGAESDVSGARPCPDQTSRLPRQGSGGSLLSVVARAFKHLYRTTVRWP